MNTSTPKQSLKERRQHRYFMIGALVFIVLVIGILGKGLTLNPETGTSALVGKLAKEFRASWLQGQEFLSQTGESHFTLADLKGKPLILNFWASWCVSCRSEAQILEAFWQAHKDEGVLVVGIAIQDTSEDSLKFARYFGKTYPLGIDEGGKASIDYGVTGVPETFFIDSEGTIRHKIAGPVDYATLEKYLPQLKTAKG